MRSDIYPLNRKCEEAQILRLQVKEQASEYGGDMLQLLKKFT
jgi:hypothetical protein